MALVIQGQGADGDKADAHAEPDEVDDEIKIVELHGGLDAPALPMHPGVQLLAGLGTFFDKKPILLSEPFQAAFRFCERHQL